MKKLIAYYSRDGENFVDGKIRVLSEGNVLQIVKKLACCFDADIFEIKEEKPYSPLYKECVEQAKKDFLEDRHPALAKELSSVEEYEDIYLGYPNYCGTMPMACFSFLESLDLTGKRIYPFCSNEGSGLGRSINDIKKCAPSAKIIDGLAIHGNKISLEELKAWVNKEI